MRSFSGRANVAPPKFRELIAGGFAIVERCVLFHDHDPTLDLRAELARVGAPTLVEGAANTRALEPFLEPDDSRRPVDLAGTVLGCARWLASELRRRGITPCRVIARLLPYRTTTITFHTLRTGATYIAEDLDAYGDEALLVLDTGAL